MVTKSQLVEMIDQGLRSDAYDNLPARMLPSVYGYIVEGKRPGDFLCSVIQNDLLGAIALSDSQNLQLLPLWVRFFYNVAPSSCYGSPEKMNKWMLTRQQDRE